MLLNINEDPVDHSQCVLSYDEAEGWLQARWSGYVDQAEAMRGAQAYLMNAAKVPSGYLFNDNSRLKGPWFESLDWLVHVWVPSASRLGLRYVAHVVQQNQHHDIFTCRPLTDLPFELQIFQDADDARHWLRQVRDQAVQ
ncbi:hypothetical protein HHL22_18680 [Hymenobacter sp. RP-2-7]|uniref:STAS/SEC14 domain-containing protein n=1 Tax=Hymenobacter polaris TaxID=2682546 RepID=A0A7Y0AHL0_9BACT|nr:hypothetical protein [Hymenobacter polaris]NML67235.1 hypothetical protein [Hymenobacter polaris]